MIRRREFLFSAAAPLLGSSRKSCILLRLTGGPSQLDTWDMKPDAPSEIRGPFRAVRTNVAGIEISEIFPRMARHADKYALIRSVYQTGPAVHQFQLHPGSVVLEQANFGQNCVRAMRLVERGARFVTVNMFPPLLGGNTWDMHGWGPFSSASCYRDVVGPMYDRACSALLENLHRGGLLEKTLVVSMGEFGRTPRINPSGGRDHWPHCWTIMIAGGGIRGGQVYGSSDKWGAEPRDNPVTPAMITATINRTLGIQDSPQDSPAPVLPLF